MQRTLKVNCNDDPGCGCERARVLAAHRATTYPGNRSVAAHSFKDNLRASETRRETLNGVDHLVLPVVMARAGVVMNGALTLEEELFPDAWNGVPVTLGHPELPADGGFTTANHPEIIEAWGLGAIYNASVVDGALRGEAWIDVAKTERLSPGLIDQLTAGSTNTDVSTGYYSRDEKARGTSNGRSYERVARDLLPDHLALLPGDTGACSWEDGCGIRTNRQSGVGDRISAALDTIREALTGQTNLRGEDDDFRQMVADLISNDLSPFVPNDEFSLREMSYDSLKTLRDDYVTRAGEEAAREAAKAARAAKKNDNHEGGHPLTEAKPGGQANASDLPKTVDELNTLIVNALAAALPGALTKALEPMAATIQTNALSADDRAALDTARRILADSRTGMIDRIVANSTITKEQAEAMPSATLEIVANGLVPTASYGGRNTAFNAAEDDDPAVAAMITSNNLRAAMVANSQKAN